MAHGDARSMPRRSRRAADLVASVSRSRFGLHAIRDARKRTLCADHGTGSSSARRAAGAGVCAGGATVIGVIYHQVPPAVESVHVLSWQDGRPPVDMPSSPHNPVEPHLVRIECAAGAEIVVTFARRDA